MPWVVFTRLSHASRGKPLTVVHVSTIQKIQPKRTERMKYELSQHRTGKQFIL